jgi:hypothetical protein
VWAKVEWHTNADGTVTIKASFSKTFADNTYGANAIGWPSGHTFNELVGSDHVRMRFTDMNGTVFFDGKIDYITASGGGYDTLGVTGGDGRIYLGSASDVTNVRTSIAENFNTLGCAFTTDSPATDENYTPPASCPGWDYTFWYEVTLDPSSFGPAGFGWPTIDVVHASPSKTGLNTEPVAPGPSPTPAISPTPTPTENICGDC